MKKHLPISIAILAALTATLLAGVAVAQDDAQAILSFIVLRDGSGKPIRNASVVMHPVRKDGKQGKGGLELKADADGRCHYEGVPYGKIRVQALAPGFQTFGQDYDVDKPTMEITIKLKRPEGQYSIYSDQQNTKKDDAPAGGTPNDPQKGK